MIPITTEGSLTFLTPSFLLLEPTAAKELPNASIIRLLLRRFKGNELVEILVNRRRVA